VPEDVDASRIAAVAAALALDRGWGFEGFKGDSTTERAVGKNAAAACHQCRTQQKDRDFVFSGYRR
jgi:hypothetical protein